MVQGVGCGDLAKSNDAAAQQWGDGRLCRQTRPSSASVLAAPARKMFPTEITASRIVLISAIVLHPSTTPWLRTCPHINLPTQTKLPSYSMKKWNFFFDF